MENTQQRVSFISIGIYGTDYATCKTAKDLGPISGPSNVVDEAQGHDHADDYDTFTTKYMNFSPKGYVNPRDIEGAREDADERDMLPTIQDDESQVDRQDVDMELGTVDDTPLAGPSQQTEAEEAKADDVDGNIGLDRGSPVSVNSNGKRPLAQSHTGKRPPPAQRPAEPEPVHLKSNVLFAEPGDIAADFAMLLAMDVDSPEPDQISGISESDSEETIVRGKVWSTNQSFIHHLKTFTVLFFLWWSWTKQSCLCNWRLPSCCVYGQDRGHCMYRKSGMQGRHMGLSSPQHPLWDEGIGLNVIWSNLCVWLLIPVWILVGEHPAARFPSHIDPVTLYQYLLHGGIQNSHTFRHNVHAWAVCTTLSSFG